MDEKVSPSDLVGASEISEKLGLAFPNIVHAWKRRHQNFPRLFQLLQWEYLTPD